MGIFCPNANILSNLFKEMGMLGCKPMDNPIERNHKFKDCYEEPETDWERCQRLVGRLIYPSHTCPDIAYAVSVISHFIHATRDRHIEATY